VRVRTLRFYPALVSLFGKLIDDAVFELLAHRAIKPPTSTSLAEDRVQHARSARGTPPLTQPLHGGARLSTLAALVERHLGYRQQWFAPMLGRLAVPDRELAQVSRLLPAESELRVTVINTGGAGGLVALAQRAIPGLAIEAVESPLRDLDDLESNAARIVAAAAELPEGIETYVELPYAPGWQTAVELVEADGLLGKIRIDGGQGGQLPSAEQVADQLSVLIEADLPFSAAGLDRAWPGDPSRLETPTRHGLLNLLAAVEALIDGAEQHDAVNLLQAGDHDGIVATIGGWDATSHDWVRRRLRNIGCRQVLDLIDDLVATGLLAPPA
jgi:hypothetical protein